MMGGTHTRRASYIGLALVLTVATAIGAAQYGWWRYMTIAVDQAMAEGTVLRTDCRSNNEVSYSFSVQGNVLEGSDSWMDCRGLRPGDKLPISFSARDPTQNMPGNGYGRFLAETISILLGCVFGSLVVAAVFVYPFGKKRS